MTATASDTGSADRLATLEKRVRMLEEQVETLSRAGLEGRTFAFKGESLHYALHRPNRTYANERAVELPIAWRALQAVADPERVMEVGNVTSHYFDTSHAVLDKFERHPRVRHNLDVLDFRPDDRLELVLSVSTLEHVGFSDGSGDPGKFARAVAHIVTWLAPSGRLLFTVPLGYNPAVDEFLRTPPEHVRDIVYMRRTSAVNTWEETDASSVRGVRHATPYPCANAIAVVDAGPSQRQS